TERVNAAPVVFALELLDLQADAGRRLHTVEFLSGERVEQDVRPVEDIIDRNDIWSAVDDATEMCVCTRIEELPRFFAAELKNHGSYSVCSTGSRRLEWETHRETRAASRLRRDVDPATVRAYDAADGREAETGAPSSRCEERTENSLEV